MRLHIADAKNLPNADSWLGGGASDPYVKVTDLATGREYAETKVVYNTMNPVWNQVFYIPIYDICKKLNFTVNDYNAFFKDVLLGSYTFDLKELIKVKADKTIEGKRIDKTVDLRHKGAAKGQLQFAAQFISFSSDFKETKKLDATSVSISHLYLIVTLQRQNGSFEIDNRLAVLFNFSTVDELVRSFHSTVASDDKLKKLDKSIILSVYISSFLKILLWKHRSEWLTFHAKTETCISESVNDVEVEERLYAAVNSYVIKRYSITKWESDEHKRICGVAVETKTETKTETKAKTTIITHRTITIHVIRRIISYQSESGSYKLDTHLAGSLGFESTEVAQKALQTHFSSYSKVAKLDVHIYSTAILLWYFRYTMVDHRDKWAIAYKKSSAWLSAQINNKEVEEELLEAARIFVVKRYEVDEEILEKDKSFKATLKITNETVSEEVKKQIEIDEEEEATVADVISETVVGVVRIKIDRAKDLSTGGFFQTNDPYVRILDASSKEIARTKAVAKTTNPVWEEVHYVSVHGEKDKITLEILDENLFVDDSPLGYYVLHLCELINGKRLDKWEKVTRPNGKGTKGEIHIEAQFYSTKLAIDERFVFSKDNVDVNHLYTLISWRLSVGAFEATDSLARYFNFKSQQELIEAFKTHVAQNKQLLSLDLSVWSTVLTITYIKLLHWKFRDEWALIINNSERWVSSQVYDVEVEDHLYECARTFVVKRFNITLTKEQETSLQISGNYNDTDLKELV